MHLCLCHCHSHCHVTAGQICRKLWKKGQKKEKNLKQVLHLLNIKLFKLIFQYFGSELKLTSLTKADFDSELADTNQPEDAKKTEVHLDRTESVMAEEISIAQTEEPGDAKTAELIEMAEKKVAFGKFKFVKLSSIM